MPRIFTSPKNPQSRSFAAILGGTIFGPVIEVQSVKILNQYGFEIAIPSPDDHVPTSYVVISRKKSRFVDEVHIPDAGLRPSSEQLTELQRSEGRKSCEEQADSSIQETGSTHVSNYKSNKDICADTLSISPSQASFLTQRTILTTERMWKVIPATSSHGRALAITVSKMVTR